jgi:hypothetical protein
MTSDDDDTTERDASQLVPPEIDAGIRVKGLLLNDLAYGTPGYLLIGLGVLLLIYWGTLLPGLVSIGVGIIVSVAGIVFSMRTDEYATGIDRVLTRVTYALKQRKLPFSQEEATAIHGVKRIHADGSAETTDDRVVMLARLHGRNTDLQESDDSQQMIGTLRQHIDEDIEDFGFDIHSTTVGIDADAVTEKYRQQWTSETFGGEDWAAARVVLQSIVEWETHQQEEVWETPEWQHYLVVSVSPDEIDLPEFATPDEAEESWRDRLTDRVGISTTDEDDQRWQARRRRMRAEAQSRVTKLRQAFGAVDGVETEPIGPAAHALVLSRFWSGVDHDFTPEQVTESVNVSVWPHYYSGTESPRPDAVETDEDADATSVADVTDREAVAAAADGGSSETVTQSVASSTTAHDDPSETLGDDEAADASLLARVREGLFAPVNTAIGAEPDDEDQRAGVGQDHIQDLLAPSQYDDRDDTSGGFVVAGDQYCRTYWIADWPIVPTEKFLRNLYTLRGVDLDVHLSVQARDQEAAIEDVKHEIGKIDANIMERKAEADSLEALMMEDELEEHVKFIKLLRHTDAQPWLLSGYVTVRVGTRRALDDVQELIEEGLVDESQLTLDVAKQQALEDACDDVTDVLEGSPAKLTPRADAQRQGELFESCSPTGRDAYAESSWRSRRRLTPSGTIAAAFPPVSSYIQHDDGVEQGRRVTNGSVITADPFEEGAGHVLTAGKTGSGKTWSALMRAIRWYLVNPTERTLVLTDTKAAFTGVTDLLNGNHITLDGTTTLNPLHMEPMSQAVVSSSGVDPYEMKRSQVTDITLDIIGHSADVRNRFRPLVSDAVDQTMKDAGIKPGKPATHVPANSPTMADVRQKVEEMGNSPGDFVGTTLEANVIEGNAGELLRHLSGFTPDGKYSFLVGQSDTTVEPGAVNYLDLQQLEGKGSAADEATMLNLALNQVYEAVKRTSGKTMFLIDEAYYLLESKEILRWLNESSRSWRHNDAGLWFISQAPGDFIEDDDADKKRWKGAIREQVNTTEIFKCDKLSDYAAGQDGFGLNDRQTEFVRERATAGSEDATDYSECLVNYANTEGWVRAQVRMSPAEQTVLAYKPDEDGDFDEYLRREWGDF